MRIFDYLPLKKLRLRAKIVLGVILFLVLFFAAGFFYLKKTHTVRNIIVTGNAHYTEKEIIDMVVKEGELFHNSFFLKQYYHKKTIEDIPFVSALEVEILDPETIRITVYEKALAGFVPYLDRYIYFDREGTVVESSKIRTEGIPEVSGLDFDHAVMYEPLPVDNPEVFAKVLDITKSLAKYELSADRISFDKNSNITLYFEDVRVRIGNGAYIDEKFSRMRSILPELTGMKGTLEMADFTPDTTSVPFHKDS